MQRIALTIGDPTGIGPEITLKALQRLDDFPGVFFTVLGDVKSLEKTAADIGLSLPQNLRVKYVQVEGEKPGQIAYAAIDKAVQMISVKEADVMVTGPISKKNLHDAGHNFPGHTEILQQMAHHYFPHFKDARAEMLFVFKKLRLLLLTRHVPLSEVPALIAKPGAVAKPIKTLISYLRKERDVLDAKIAVLGLNPHAGEVGGDEEKKYLSPIIHAVNGIGNSQLDGPLAADGYFRSLDVNHIKHDAIVACYHDQGLIPFKMLAGYEAVNVTIGLPFVRTSVSHGTAEDIVGKNIARDDSLLAAIREALITP